MLTEYLVESKYINYSHPLVKQKAEELCQKYSGIELIKATYHFVRDEIHHSWDAQDKRVTVTASDALMQGVGICWAKANLLAALLRANNIPSGFSYQRLTLGDTPDTGYCIHVLNTVYIEELNKWIRLDARGNKEGVNAEFSLDEEKLAFKISSEGEIDYRDNHASPDLGLMKVLEESCDAIDMYLHHLPDQLSCIFCNRHMISTDIVYENDTVMAFMDIDPINEGHVLIVPKNHYLDVDEIPDDVLIELTMTSKKMAKAIKKAFNPGGYSIMQNGGKFNDIGHYHLHVFPRYEGDGFGWTDGGERAVNSEIADKIRKAL